VAVEIHMIKFYFYFSQNLVYLWRQSSSVCCKYFPP